MKERVGIPLTGSAADAVKQRVETYDQMKEMMASLDMENASSWAAYVNNDHAMFMADQTDLPFLAYALTKLTMAVLHTADKADNEMIKLAARAAVAKVWSDEITNDEVTEDEND